MKKVMHQSHSRWGGQDLKRDQTHRGHSSYSTPLEAKKSELSTIQVFYEIYSLQDLGPAPVPIGDFKIPNLTLTPANFETVRPTMLS